MSVHGYEVVISGFSGSFPDCRNANEFKEKLFSKTNLLREDTDRWNPAETEEPFMTGKLPDAEGFDATFFGINPRLALQCNPLMAHALEKSTEAIFDAGLNPYSLKGKNICVVAATSLNEAEPMKIYPGRFMDGNGMIGVARTMLANMLSYHFHFVGPSYSVDSSWTSAVQGLEMAANLVAQGAVEAAVVTSVNLIFLNSVEEEYNSFNCLSHSAKCSPFDAKADGFLRSESAVSFYLQRGEDAKRKYCTLINCQARCLGDRACSFVKMCPSLETFLRNFYNESRTHPQEVCYIETSGLSQKHFDTEELNAVAAVLSHHRATPLEIGSVSGNLGTAECAASFVSLAKAIITLENGVIPPTINYQNPNLDIPDLVNGLLKPTTEPKELTGDLVAVNGITMFGNATHILLRKHNKTKRSLQSVEELPPDGLPRLVTLLARHKEGAQEIIKQLLAEPVDVEQVYLANDVFRSPIPSYLWRAYAILPAIRNKSTHDIQLYNSTKHPVWYIFSGMGSQWPGMGRDLLRVPVFAAAVDRCDQVLRPRGIDIKHILTTDDRTIFDNILNCFVGIAAIQIGLVDILRAIGVTPDGMIGHSVGELGCAYADGCFTADEMILAAYARGRASLEAKLISGLMAAVGKGFHEMKALMPPSIDVACHNSAENCTLSGPSKDVLQFIEGLKNKGVFAKAVSTGGIAYHSRYIKPAGGKLLQYLREMLSKPKARSSRWICSSMPQSLWNTEEVRMNSPEYHTNNLLNPVLFEEACQHLPKNAILVEIAPHGLLQAILRRSISGDSINIPLTNRIAESTLHHLLSAIGRLHIHNVPVDVNALYPPVKYPVSRGTSSLASLITWDHTESRFHEFKALVKLAIQKGLTETVVPISPDSIDSPLWTDHCLDDQVVLPLSQILIYSWKFMLMPQQLKMRDHSVVFSDIIVSEHVSVAGDGRELCISTSRSSSAFHVSLQPNGSVFLTGSMEETTVSDLWVPERPKTNTEDVLTADVYSLLAHLGCELGPQFQNIEELAIGEKEVTAKVKWTGNIVTFIDALFKVASFKQIEEQQTMLQPSSFKRLIVNYPPLNSLAPGTLVDVHYNQHCNRMVCEYVELLGLTLSPTTMSSPRSLIWSEIKFHPYFDNIPMLGEMLSCSLQMITGTTKSTSLSVLLTQTDREETPDILNTLKTTLKELPNLNFKLREVDSSQVKQHQSQDRCLLVGDLNCVTSVAADPSFTEVYYLTYWRGTRENWQSLKTLLTHESPLGTIALLKKSISLVDTKVVQLEDPGWLRTLRQTCCTGRCIVVFRRSLKPRVVLPVLSAEPFAHQIMSVFILDSDAPQFSLSIPQYFTQLSLGLPVNILSGGQWGYLPTIRTDSVLQNDRSARIFKSSDDSLELAAVGLNTTMFTIQKNSFNSKPELKYMDYSGRLAGKPVMGVAQLGSNCLAVDRILKWPIPPSWTMEDAASVPVVYFLAYYCTHVKSKVQPGENVLVHAGLSPIGQAILNIVIQMGANVFTSVEEESDVKCLLENVPSLDPSHIFVLNGQNWEVRMKTLTAGRGAEVIINCLRGEGLQATIKVMGNDCRFLHLAPIAIENRESIGMFNFFKRTSLHGISLESINSSNNESKVYLQKCILEGIKDGVVKPLRRGAFPSNLQSEAMLHNTKNYTKEKTVIVSTSHTTSLQFSPDSLLIITGSANGLWLDVAEWVIKLGARKLAIFTEDGCSGSGYSRRFKRLVHHYRCPIMFYMSSRFDSYADTVSLFKELLPIGPIHYIFCLSMDNSSGRIHNLDRASRQLLPDVRQFVCLLTEGTGVCESRAASGLSACSVQSNRPLHRPALMLPYLPTLLANNSSLSRFVVVSEEVSQYDRRDFHDSQNFLPSAVADLHELGLVVAEKERFTEVVTRSPGYQYTCYNLLPVFIIPGPHNLQPLFRQLINPAFSCSLPTFTLSVQKFAESIFQDILKIQERGPYNIVGDSWNSAVAFVLACMFESRGDQVALFLLEDTHFTAQERVKALCEMHSADLGSSLLAATIDLTQQERKEISEHKNWSEKLRVAMMRVPVSARATVSRALTSLYSQLSALLQFQPPSHLFQGKITLITKEEATPSDTFGLSKMCQGEHKIVRVGEDLNKQLTGSIINDNCLFHWQM